MVSLTFSTAESLVLGIAMTSMFILNFKMIWNYNNLMIWIVKNILYFQENIDNVYTYIYIYIYIYVYRKLNLGEIMVFVF